MATARIRRFQSARTHKRAGVLSVSEAARNKIDTAGEDHGRSGRAPNIELTADDLHAMNPDIVRALHVMEAMRGDEGHDPEEDEEDVAFRSTLSAGITEPMRKQQDRPAFVGSDMSETGGGEMYNAASRLPRNRHRDASGQTDWMERLEPSLRERAEDLYHAVRQIEGTPIVPPARSIMNEALLAQKYGFVRQPRSFAQAIYALFYISYTAEELRAMAAQQSTNLKRRNALLKAAEQAMREPNHMAPDPDASALMHFASQSVTISSYIILMDLRKKWLEKTLPSEFQNLPFIAYKKLDPVRKQMVHTNFTSRAAIRHIQTIVQFEAEQKQRDAEIMRQQQTETARTYIEELRQLYNAAMGENGLVNPEMQLNDLDVGSSIGSSLTSRQMATSGQLSSLYHINDDGSVSLDQSDTAEAQASDVFTSRASNQNDRWDTPPRPPTTNQQGKQNVDARDKLRVGSVLNIRRRG
jgi:hypothetical protein